MVHEQGLLRLTYQEQGTDTRKQKPKHTWRITHPSSKSWEAAALLQLYGHLQIFLLVSRLRCHSGFTLGLFGQLNPVALHIIIVLPVQVLIQLHKIVKLDAAENLMTSEQMSRLT